MTDSDTHTSGGNLTGRALVAVALLTVVGGVVFLVVRGNRREPPQPPPDVVAPAPPPKVSTTPQIPFVDVTQQYGIDYVHRTGADGEKLLPESGGGGAAFFDYDRDGDPDLLLISGRSWPWSDSAKDDVTSSLALYRNDQERFTDVTDEAGLKLLYYGQGVAVGDYDGDGDDDLFLTAVGANHMFRNDNGRFVNVTEETGVGGSPHDWTTGAGFFDYDRDGDLDLYVCNYIRWSREIDQSAGYRLVGIGRTYAPPFNFEGTQSYLFRNDGGRFVDVSVESGIHITHESSGKPVGKALGLTFVDFDRDGWLDVLVANDTVRNFLFRNRGDGTFEEMAEWQRFAFDANGGATSAMGIDVAWFRNNDDLAVAIGNFANEMTSLFVLQGEDPVFTDEAIAAGVGGPTRTTLTFGLLLSDMDLDGRVDLVLANGHLEEEINTVQPSQQYRQPAQLFWNAGADYRHDFTGLASKDVGDLAKPIVGRGLTAADIDGDGDLDLLFTQVAGPPMLLRNDQQTNHHWLRVQLEGPPGNPHGIGATVEVRTADTVQRRVVTPTRSYMCQTESTMTFGLGSAEQVDSLTVIWPDSSQQQLQPEGVDRVLTVRQEVETFASFMNVAKALLENGRYDEAAEVLDKALVERPRSAAALRNLVRARLFGGKPDEAARSLQALMQPGSSPTAANTYLSGLLAMRQSRYEDAVSDFRAAVQLDSTGATLRFQLATALAALGQDEEAERQFEKTAELDPLHGGAQFQLASYARRRGDRESFTRYNRDYQRIRELKGPTTTDTLTLEACLYTQAEAASPSPAAPPDAAAEPANFQLVPLTATDASPLPPFADVAVDHLGDNGRYEWVAVFTNGQVAAWQLDDDGHIRVITQTESPLDLPDTKVRLRVGNAVVDPLGPSDAPTGDHNELAVVTPTRSWLLRYRRGEGFDDLTPDAGLAPAAGDTARWVDLEHDGDLDLCVVTAQQVHAWRNNGDGHFVQATEDFQLGNVSGGTDIAATDLDGSNLGVDLVVANPQESVLLRNQYAGRFAAERDASMPWPGAEHVVVDDFNNDGLAEIVLVGGTSLEVRSSTGERSQTLALALERVDVVVPVDYDNDGWLDLAILGGEGEDSRAILLRNTVGSFTVCATGLPAVDAQRAIALDVDDDQDTDVLVVSRAGELVLLRNETPQVGRQLKLLLNSFVGNPSSIGTRVQVRRDEHVVTRWTDCQLPIEIGMGRHNTADSVQTLWMNGVAHNEVNVSLTDKPLWVAVIEFVRTSSCPFLYAFSDGAWQFVTDLLGASPLNVAVARDVPMPADSDEVVLLGTAASLTQDTPSPQLRITTELREVIYLDEVQLLVVDHPREVTIFSGDRAAPVGVPGKTIWAGRDPIRLRAAIGSDGAERRDALAVRDGVFAVPGDVLPHPVVGHMRPLSIEFEFDEIDSSQPMLLVLTGWFRFGSSSTNIAASQRGDLEVIWPRLEAQGPDGQWHLVEESVGFPAGNTKSIICDLAGKLPTEVQKFRLSTSFEVRWDEIALYHRVAVDTLTVSESPPTVAQMDWHGFAELRPTSEDQPQIPNLRRMTDRPPWLTTTPGWCTRYGDVLPLLTASDERLAILNSGDGVTLSFELPTRRSPENARTLLLYTRGWIKECDTNAIGEDRVAPFPGSDRLVESEGNDWQLEYNTRWVPRDRFTPNATGRVVKDSK